jgi:Na+/citrate or Na+/malate symporter
VKGFVGFLLVLVIIGVGLRMAGMRIPVIDYPFGGPMAQPQIDIVEPDLNLP